VTMVLDKDRQEKSQPIAIDCLQLTADCFQHLRITVGSAKCFWAVGLGRASKSSATDRYPCWADRPQANWSRALPTGTLGGSAVAWCEPPMARRRCSRRALMVTGVLMAPKLGSIRCESERISFSSSGPISPTRTLRI
jgi:hypothetical protein